MPELVSTAVVAGYAMALYLTTRTCSAVSPEARDVRRSASAIIDSAEKSVALFGAKNDVFSQIYAAVEESANEGEKSDGEVASDVVGRAEDFIRALPNDLPMPEVAVEPGGWISLDWIQARSRVFSVSVGDTNRLAFAWIDGTDRGHGVARFDGDAVPQRILTGIRELTNGAATLGAA